jgi:hypothetical protein
MTTARNFNCHRFDCNDDEENEIGEPTNAVLRHGCLWNLQKIRPNCSLNTASSRLWRQKPLRYNKGIFEDFNDILTDLLDIYRFK